MSIRTDYATGEVVTAAAKNEENAQILADKARLDRMLFYACIQDSSLLCGSGDITENFMDNDNEFLIETAEWAEGVAFNLKAGGDYRVAGGLCYVRVYLGAVQVGYFEFKNTDGRHWMMDVDIVAREAPSSTGNVQLAGTCNGWSPGWGSGEANVPDYNQENFHVIINADVPNNGDLNLRISAQFSNNDMSHYFQCKKFILSKRTPQP